MSKITNTAASDPIEKFLVALDPNGRGIEDQEARGQRELVSSTQLPTEVLYATDADLEALGFSFGPPDPSDPMFRDATLPVGWTKQGSAHAMWSYIVDERGLERVSVFYKAAFYDRSAHMGITKVGSSVASKAIYSETPVAIPWDVLTPEERADAVDELNGMLRRCDEHPDIYGKHRERAESLIAEASGATCTPGGPRMSDVHGAIARDLDGFGGFLRCETCGHRKVLGDVGYKLRHGWPKCCGYTMRWWTRRQVNAGEVPT